MEWDDAPWYWYLGNLNWITFQSAESASSSTAAVGFFNLIRSDRDLAKSYVLCGLVKHLSLRLHDQHISKVKAFSPVSSSSVIQQYNYLITPVLAYNVAYDLNMDGLFSGLAKERNS